MRNTQVAVWAVAAAAVLWTPGLALAGGGPENVAVVVNGDSWASVAVVNEFVRLRKVPPCNVVYISGLPDFQATTIDAFRDGILQPVLSTLENRGLAEQIDYIVYSSDIPTEVDLQSEVTPEVIRKLPGVVAQTVRPTGSLTGLTFLYQLVRAKDTNYVTLSTNWYYRPVHHEQGKAEAERALGFRSSFAWNPKGSIVPADQGMKYLLSTMLAVTSGRGNSVREATACLQSAASADGNRPDGAIYYMKNTDVRSKVRDSLFGDAVDGLKALGVRGEVLDGVLPQGKKDVAGLMTGTVDFNWKNCGSRILPGAICENFTSWGGVMREDGSQTPLSEFIRYGAAGTSGTVVEPLAIPAKFPNPFMHVHYARGCSLAEAYYQSVAGPYQLLVVGDPLCQPWAKAPKVEVECKTAGGSVVSPGAAVSGKLEIHPRGADKEVEIGRYELFVNGVRRAACAEGETLPLDTDALAEGYHELRVVGVGKAPPETQGRLVFPLRVSRGGGQLFVTAPAEKAVSWDAPLTLSAKLVGGKKIVFLQNGREVGKIAGPEGGAKIDLRAVGQGRVSIQAVGVMSGKDGNEKVVMGEPIELEVRPPMPVPPPPPPAADTLAKGVQVVIDDGKKSAVTKYADDWLTAAGLKKDREFQLQACFNAPEDDTYQFQLKTNMALTMEVDSRAIGIPKEGQWKFIPVSLIKGTHRLLIKGKGVAGPLLDLRFGGPGSYRVMGTFSHVKVAGET